MVWSGVAAIGACVACVLDAGAPSREATTPAGFVVVGTLSGTDEAAAEFSEACADSSTDSAFCEP